MVEETHTLTQNSGTEEYTLVDERGHAVLKLGITSLKQAKKRSLIFLQKKEKNK
jgi:glycine cleavage system H lipoate-binding protein|tara:strand:+ start:38 stop:199 length:162 start_codon:yes stop_codon:yes gene_type:complete